MNTYESYESYVSLETAKLLKQAGFDWPTRYSYDLFLYSTEGEKRVIDGFASTFCNEHNGLASMPTLDIAQRWLREVKESFIGVNPISIEYDIKWQYVIIGYEGFVCAGEEVDAYEEAQESGIRKALEIILEKGEQVL